MLQFSFFIIHVKAIHKKEEGFNGNCLVAYNFAIKYLKWFINCNFHLWLLKITFFTHTHTRTHM